jgi:hypothetical protein
LAAFGPDMVFQIHSGANYTKSGQDSKLGGVRYPRRAKFGGYGEGKP